MRKTLAWSGVALSLVLAGCGSQAAEPTPDTGTEPSQSSQSKQVPETDTSSDQESQRTAPAKALKIADLCSIVPEKRWRALGADDAPRVTEVSGVKGCSYRSANGKYWFMFVSLEKGTPMQKFAAEHPRGTDTKIAGYPAYQTDASGGCLVAVDVSDNGSLQVNGRVSAEDETSTFTSCSVAKKLAKAAVKNLPNAKGA